MYTTIPQSFATAKIDPVRQLTLNVSSDGDDVAVSARLFTSCNLCSIVLVNCASRFLTLEALECGMTNYRIGTHRQASAQFHGVNIGQTTAGKVSKQMDSSRRPTSKTAERRR